ncbi:MAG: hypothetical protein ACTHJ3_19600 [Pararhizobium sp.]
MSDNFVPTGSYVARGVEHVDPRLREILQKASETSDYRVEAYSGFRPGDPRFHGKGEATDIRLVDKKTGKALPNYQTPETFSAYQAFANDARRAQQELYPELDQAFRWGGYFGGPRGKYGSMDLMHFDLGGSHSLGMAGGSWEGGLNDHQRQLYGMTGAGTPASSDPVQSVVDAAPGPVARGPLANAATPAPAETVPDPRAEGNLGTSNIEIPADPAPAVQQPDAAPGIWQLEKDAFSVEQTLPWLLQQGTDTQPDPNWSLTTDRLSADLKERGLDPQEYASWMQGSHSEANYQENLGKAQIDLERQQRLAQGGLTGGFLRLANSILDPIALGADIAASTIVPEVAFGRRAVRTARAVETAFGGAAGGLASAGVSYAVNPHRDQMDLLYGTVFGFGLGGLAGTLGKSEHTLAESAAATRMAQNEVSAHEGVDLPGIAMAGSAGAARSAPEREFLNDEAFQFVQHEDAPKSAFLRARGDLFAMLDKSKNPVTRLLAGLVNDGTGKVGGAINAFAASEERAMFRDEWVSAFHRFYNPAAKEFLADNGGVLGRARAELEFNRQVDTYIRDRSVAREQNYHKAVVRLGNQIAKLQADMLEMARNPFVRERLIGQAVKGFEEVRPDPHYMMRLWDPDRVVLATREYADGTLDDFVFGAMRSANPDVDEALLRRTAKGFAKAIISRAHGLDDVAVRALGAEDMQSLVEVLTSNGVSKADAEELLRSFRGNSHADGKPIHAQDDGGRDARAKRRILLDESYRLSRPIRKDGTVDEEGLGLDDLIVKDAAYAYTRYADNMAGLVALARFRLKDPVTGDMLVDGITSDGEFGKLIDIVRKRGADEVSKGHMTQREVDADVQRLEFAYSAIRGRPLSDVEKTDAGWWMRSVRKFNFSRIMNQVGFAQVAEAGVTVGALGVKAAFSQVPALRRIMTEDGETVLKSGLGRDLEAWLGDVGTERLRHPTDYQFDEVTGLREEVGRGWRAKADSLLHKANRVTSEVSGMTQANILLERWTAASIVQKFANMAAKGGKGMSEARLADLGLDKDMTSRIMRMFNEEGNFEYTPSLITGRKVARAHFDAWNDKEAAEAFRRAVFRYGRQLIQKNDIGNMMKWMSNPAAKMLMQFRTFMVGAYGRQTLKALHFRDRQAAMAAIMTTAVAGAVYVLQSKLQAVGRSDAKQWLDNRLTWKNIGTAAFARAGYSSILPMLIDTGRFTVGADGLFSHTRTTGQASNMIFGNPTSGGIDDLTQATRALAGLFEDRPWSQQEARQVQRIMLYGNFLPVSAGINSLIGDLPLYAPKDN